MICLRMVCIVARDAVFMCLDYSRFDDAFDKSHITSKVTTVVLALTYKH